MASVPQNPVYGRNQGEVQVFAAPLVAKRIPTTNDINYQIGRIWVVPSLNVAYILTSVVSNSANWNLIESSGAAGIFSSLVVTPGPISLTGTTTINTAGAGVTTINTGGTGALNLGNATGNTAVTGTLTSSGAITASSGNITATLGNVVASAGNITATLGNIAATAGSVSAGTTVTAGTGITATTGNITATNGDIVLSTATNKIQLPGPVNIMSGAGAPANGLAVNVGDMYINTTAASATTRLYIATAASTWTNVTCAA